MVGHRLGDFLRKHLRDYLDTSTFIYFVQRHPRYFDLCDRIFRDVEEGRIEGLTSTLTLLQLLVQPCRLKREDIVLEFYSLFTTYPHLKWIQLSLGISDLAAKLRAEYNLKTPDAVLIASAHSNGAAAFICNDRTFLRVKDVECLILHEWA